MKRTIYFLLLLAMLSAASGYLMSKASWIARVDITFFHKQMNLLKIWWQGAIAVFIVLTLLFLLHAFIQKRLSNTSARILHFILLLTAIAGMYLTYDDFTTNLSHRLTGKRFHYGVYLWWMGWILTCIFFLFRKKPQSFAITNTGKTDEARQ